MLFLFSPLLFKTDQTNSSFWIIVFVDQYIFKERKDNKYHINIIPNISFDDPTDISTN